jgi:hypothetical protein
MNTRRRQFFATLGATFGLSACNGIDVAEWTEEVKLHDGTMIQVWRRARARSSGFPNANRGGDIDFELKYAPLGVQWKGSWNRSPISFEIIDGVPHLVLYIGNREACANKAKTDYMAEFLRWSNGQWVEVPQAAFPTEKARVNLHAQYWGHSTRDDARGFLHWSDKTLYGNRDDTIKTYFERGQRFCSRLGG